MKKNFLKLMAVLFCSDVTVKSGVEYEIEASGTVRLEDGFIVEKGATFAVYPASY